LKWRSHHACFAVFSTGVDPVAILAASIMSAPAALAISKIAYPETEESTTSTGKRGAYDIPISDDVNVVHAASNGAVIGTQLMLNIAGNLIAFLAIIQMLDSLLIYLGDRVDISLSFNIVCQYLFWPFAWLMGVDTDDCEEVAILIGLKIFANEFVAYARLTSPDVVNKLTARSFYIASYALCGFSNFGSIGIMLGGLTPMAPAQGPKLAKLVFSAMVAGNTACVMTACIAGIFYEEPGS
jgi:nucleoside transporter